VRLLIKEKCKMELSKLKIGQSIVTGGDDEADLRQSMYSAQHYAKAIQQLVKLTGVRKEAMTKFFDSHDLDATKIAKAVEQKHLDPMDIMTAISGDPKKNQKYVDNVKKHGQGKATASSVLANSSPLAFMKDAENQMKKLGVTIHQNKFSTEPLSVKYQQQAEDRLMEDHGKDFFHKMPSHEQAEYLKAFPKSRFAK
jgi:hypothetical protein